MIERYQTEEMSALWSDDARFARWTQVEIAASEVFHERGEISEADMKKLRTAKPPRGARVAELERVTDHDVVAFVRALSENVDGDASRHLHRGLTSSDVVDTALALGLVDGLKLISKALSEASEAVAARAVEHRDTPCIGRTHGVHAEPTTFGLKLANWHSELQRHKVRLERAQEQIGLGKLSGSVGNFSQTDPEFEASALAKLELKPEPIATQVIPRDRHADVLSAIALLGASLERFATEIRSLQRTEVREAEEAFKKGQTGSSSMPHKRNPIMSERLCGMARLLRGYALTGYENVALWHERDISHSSVERVTLPDAFHLAHYMLKRFTNLIANLVVFPENMMKNLEKGKGLVFSQSVLGVFLSLGHDRQEAYAVVQRCAMQVWDGESPDFLTALLEHEAVQEPELRVAVQAACSLERYQEHVGALFKRTGLA